MSTSTPAPPNTGQPRRRNRRPREPETGEPPTTNDGNIENTGRRPRNNRRNNNPASDSALTNNPTRRRDTPQRVPGDDSTENAPRPKRGAKFNAGLTDSSRTAGQGSGNNNRPQRNARPAAPQLDDLTSTLTHAMKTPPYPDCPICFSAIHPAQPTWSCSPSTPVVPIDNTSAQYCWTTFHVKCIRSWAGKSVKDVADAWLARGEDRRGDWRCPGCQAKREIVPSGYSCFCGSTPEPKPPRLATPHSCGNACSRPRTCGHACPISCHPGPCPPCQVTTQLPCFCGSTTLAFRCSHIHSNNALGGVQHSELSCGKVCGKKLSCGNHTCKDICHDGDCAPCSVVDDVRCYCGKETKTVSCGEGEAKVSVIDSVNGLPAETWVGRFECVNTCDRPFECGIHRCSKPCHPPSSSPPLCPRSPSLVSHCPCGKHELSPDSADFFPPASSKSLMRTKCTDPIPTCESMCMKPLSGCTHACAQKCHPGPCSPCSMMIVRPCRCGSMARDVACSDLRQDNVEILCDRPCSSLRACGRHTCNRICCPLASLTAKSKGKKRAVTAIMSELDPEGLHECDLVCGKPLSCGNHRCEHKDHRGACPPCLRSSFEEMVCHCGGTVMEPPIPCGTVMRCRQLCTRDPPACGHPMTPHACHEDPDSCPPCPFLTNKKCSCGKKVVGNVRCSQEKVSCGTVCGHLLGCGFHPCERLCHSDDHGSCSAMCGKPRKLCLPEHHPHTNTCHAPSACAEVEPCQSIIILTCPCKRMRQSVACGRSTSNPTGRISTQLKCTNDCTRAMRNARLAQALGINVGANGDKVVTWTEEVLAFAKANVKFLALVEKTLAEFVNSEKKTQVLPHMPPEKRKFVHDIAVVYRLDTQMVDQEPHRSVQIIRRVDTRIPTPTLSAVIAAAPTPNLGKLADLRGADVSSPWRPASTPRVRVTAPASVAGVATPALPLSTATTTSSRAPSSSAYSPRAQNVPLSAPAVAVAGSDIAVPDDWEDEL